MQYLLETVTGSEVSKVVVFIFHTDVRVCVAPSVLFCSHLKMIINKQIIFTLEAEDLGDPCTIGCGQ